MRSRFLALFTASFVAVTTSIPAAASPVSLNCSAIVGGRTYTGTVNVDSSRLDHLQVGDTVKLRNGATGTITAVQPWPYQLQGTGTLVNGQSAIVTCSK
jgi:hypothetical protein